MFGLKVLWQEQGANVFVILVSLVNFGLTIKIVVRSIVKIESTCLSLQET